MSGLFYRKSYFFKSKQVYDLLNEIRMCYPHAHIILIGNHINYEEIFKNHYRVFGVIDTTSHKSLRSIRDQIQLYLDELYNSNNG